MIDIELMDKSVTAECAGMPENVGISVALWRLRELIAGYKCAVAMGYKPAIVADEASHL